MSTFEIVMLALGGPAALAVLVKQAYNGIGWLIARNQRMREERQKSDIHVTHELLSTVAYLKERDGECQKELKAMRAEMRAEMPKIAKRVLTDPHGFEPVKEDPSYGPKSFPPETVRFPPKK